MILSIMALRQTIVHAVLWTILYSFTKNIRVSPCAVVNSSSTLVPFGSAVTASCYIKECQLEKKQDFIIKWKKNAHFIPSGNASQKNVNEIHISNFTDKQAVLECFICDHNICNVVGGVLIRAAYPPPNPQNLTCQLNLKEGATLLCMWDTGIKTSDTPTNYTLYTQIRYLDTSPLKMHLPLPGENFFKVPRECFALFQEMQVYVVAMNAIGQARSNLLVLDPMTTVKLDAPMIEGVGTQTFGCLEFNWSLSRTQKWIQKLLNIEIKMKPVNSKIYNKQQLNRKPEKNVKVCNLLHGMRYEIQMRVRYNSSPWSEWSNAANGTTPMKAPTGRLVTWLKLPRPEIRNQTAQLFWKPSLQFRANSMNVSYTVSLMGEFTKKKETVCVTDQQSCSFQIHAKVKKVCLTAMNEVGKSNPTEVPVYRRRGSYRVPFLEILPQSEESLLARWKSPDTSAISEYVLEWKPLSGTNLNLVSFEIVGKNQTSFVISGTLKNQPITLPFSQDLSECLLTINAQINCIFVSILGLEPYMPYEMSVYPKYGGVIGHPNSTMIYTKEKAPSMCPKLEIGKITPSLVELSWDEIPLEQRNGIITGYRIFYRDEKNNSRVIDADSTTRHMMLKDLYPFTIYEIFLVTSTNGGSVTGSTITVKTVSIDAFEIVLIVIPACVGLVLFFFATFACFSKQKWMKKYLWPVIPDPANSNIKKWTTADSLECMPPFKELKDPVLMYLSHVSLLSLPEKESTKGDENIKSGNWPYNSKSVDAGHDDSSHDSETFDSEQQSEAVPYATVVFAGPYRRQPVPPPVYLRSESTQPLLGEEEPSSPRPYEKMTSQTDPPDVGHFSTFHKNSHGEKKASLWGDFPMLRSLEIDNKT
ncbi:granulocyte colony-stimulating factor receptor isoform X2 [Hemibagrus wyckioides]|uniref:granulocyte colony-stimulating factor receptor isoform X2 n=1 Tax=Hemibagrus wyckioides TaxID=337641 RepID=UPI00266B75A2|nr:granulocyte colony-stimulating factor receptor isoform X2 [Hemibagrus wyckioides]XP_058249917.1 granulocyte colony-stimulating factor receptor isoform X2 [Hemibagrus wyckioides]